MTLLLRPPLPTLVKAARARLTAFLLNNRHTTAEFHRHAYSDAIALSERIDDLEDELENAQEGAAALEATLAQKDREIAELKERLAKNQRQLGETAAKAARLESVLWRMAS